MSLSYRFRLVFVFIMPIGLNNIGWKMYMVNASWDIIIFGLIVRLSPFPVPSFLLPPSFIPTLPLFLSLTILKWIFWVETKGKTLEEIDAIFDGEKHSSVPDVELVRKGVETIDAKVMEDQIAVDEVVGKVE